MTTNREMISALKYNDSFRDALRNYYSYGFLCLQSFGKSRQKTIAVCTKVKKRKPHKKCGRSDSLSI